MVGCDQKVATVTTAVAAVKSLTSGFSCSKWNASIDAMANLALTDSRGLPSNTRGMAFFPSFFADGNAEFPDSSWGLLLTTEAAGAQPGSPLFRAFGVRIDPTGGQIVELKELVNFVQPSFTRMVDVEALTGFYDAGGKETLVVPNVGNNQPNGDDSLRSLLVVDLTPLKTYSEAGAAQIILASNELAVTFGSDSATDQDGHVWTISSILPLLDFTAVFTDGKYIYMVSRAVPGDGNDLKNLYLAPTLMFRAPMDALLAQGSTIAFDLAGRLYPEAAAMLYLIRIVTNADKASSLQTLNAYTDFIGFLPDTDSRKGPLNDFIKLMHDYINGAATPSLVGFLKENQSALGTIVGQLRDGNDAGLASAWATGTTSSSSIKSLSDLYAAIAAQYGMSEQDASQAVAPALMPIVTDGIVVPGTLSGKAVDGASKAASARQLDLLTYGGQMFIGIDPQQPVPKMAQWVVENLVQFVGTPSDNTPQMEALFTTSAPPKAVSSSLALDDGFDLAGKGVLQTLYASLDTALDVNPNSGIHRGQGLLDATDSFALVRSFTCAK
jgi:hypothetical protein